MLNQKRQVIKAFPHLLEKHVPKLAKQSGISSRPYTARVTTININHPPADI